MADKKRYAEKKGRRPFTSSKSERLIELAEEINRLAAEFAHPDQKHPRILVHH